MPWFVARGAGFVRPGRRQQRTAILVVCAVSSPGEPTMCTGSRLQAAPRCMRSHHSRRPQALIRVRDYFVSLQALFLTPAVDILTSGSAGCSSCLPPSPLLPPFQKMRCGRTKKPLGSWRPEAENGNNYNIKSVRPGEGEKEEEEEKEEEDQEKEEG